MYPVRLNRAEPLIPLGVKVKWSQHRGLKLLAAARGTTMQAELEEALSRHFARARFTPPDYLRPDS